VMVAV